MRVEALRIAALDGYSLGARLAEPPDGVEPRGLVVMAPATGAPGRYYGRFASWLADRGFSALTFDYRGIDTSRSSGLRGFEASFSAWAESDLAGVLEWALARDERVLVVGHSFGGQAWGMVPQVHRTRGLVTFGTGTGWMGHMAWRERPRLTALWYLLGPVLVGSLGYLPSPWLGLGEDLPAGVYRQWRRWCGYPRYFFDDPEAEMVDRFSRITRPVVSVTSADDPWAPMASIRAFASGLTAAPVTFREVVPADLGLARIGHTAYFDDRVGQALWPRVLPWIEAVAAGQLPEEAVPATFAGL